MFATIVTGNITIVTGNITIVTGNITIVTGNMAAFSLSNSACREREVFPLILDAVVDTTLLTSLFMFIVLIVIGKNEKKMIRHSYIVLRNIC